MSEEAKIRVRQPPPPLPPEERPEAIRDVSLAVYAESFDSAKDFQSLRAKKGDEAVRRYAGCYDKHTRLYIRALKAAGWTPPTPKE